MPEAGPAPVRTPLANPAPADPAVAAPNAAPDEPTAALARMTIRVVDGEIILGPPAPDDDDSPAHAGRPYYGRPGYVSSSRSEEGQGWEGSESEERAEASSPEDPRGGTEPESPVSGLLTFLSTSVTIRILISRHCHP